MLGDGVRQGVESGERDNARNNEDANGVTVMQKSRKVWQLLQVQLMHGKCTTK